MALPQPAVDAPDAVALLLALPAASAIAAPLRGVLRAAADAARVAGSPVQFAGGTAQLIDTLGSLARLNADGEVIAATLLHDCDDWAAQALPALQADHGAVALLLDGQRAAAQVWALHAEPSRHGNVEGLRRLLLAIVRDLRVVPILLARQLAQLRSAAGLPPERARQLAALTRDIHAPLANRLGIWQLKWELEDLAFRFLQPDVYRRIATLLDDKRGGREQYVQQVTLSLRDALAAQGIDGEVAGRPKHIYSIWKKMQKKDVPIGELYDLRAVRVLVDDVPACYAALGVVHVLWAPVASEFDDYIARPKANDYRSLHTAVIGPEGKTLEVQIRTREMHAQAELGVAAHWRYKEGGAQARSSAGNAAIDRKIEWMRRLLDNNAEGGERDLRGELDSALVEDRIYVLTPLGEVIDLPRGATPLDFAYHVHTMVGHRCRGAKVDGRIVPLDHVLGTGDRVEILTGKTAEPRRDWLLASNGFLASPRSREKVRNWFNKLDRAGNLQAGKDLLDRELRRMGLLHADLAPAFAKFNVAGIDDLHVAVALGDVGPHQVGRCLLDHERALAEAAAPATAAPVSLAPRPVHRKAPSTSAFTVVGVGNVLVQIARCCQPLPGEDIAGYLTRGRGVSVHRRDCAALARLATAAPARVMEVEWGRASGGFEAAVQVQAIDRKWLLKEVTNLIAQEDVHVLAIHADPARSNGQVRLNLQLRVVDSAQLSRLLGKLDALPGVQRTRRA